MVGTDSHTTMIDGLGVAGWGVGGIEAEAAMLGQVHLLLNFDLSVMINEWLFIQSNVMNADSSFIKITCLYPMCKTSMCCSLVTAMILTLGAMW